jgi:alpha-1,2-mannosyltransferase
VVWIIGSVAFALLCYEIPTLVTAVLRPLWNNPGALQTDFHYYYEAALRFSGGGPLYLASDDVIAGFAYPPPAIVPFMMLARLPLGAALLIFTLASYLALLAAVNLWFSFLRRTGMVIARSAEVAITLIAVALAPSYMNMMNGQVNTFVLLSAVAFVSLAPLLPLIAAALLASGIWLKVYPAFLVVIGLWDRRAWRAISWAIAAAALMAVVLLPILPPGHYQTFLDGVLSSRIDKTAVHITNQSLVAFLERFYVSPELFLNWTGQQGITVGRGVRAINICLMVTAVGYIWRRFGAHRANASAAAGVMAMVAVFAPLGWGHTYVMVLPLIILHLLALRDAGAVKTTMICACVAAFLIPAGRLLPVDWAPPALQNLVYSRYLIATMVLSLLDLDTQPRGA